MWERGNSERKYQPLCAAYDLQERLPQSQESGAPYHRSLFDCITPALIPDLTYISRRESCGECQTDIACKHVIYYAKFGDYTKRLDALIISILDLKLHIVVDKLKQKRATYGRLKTHV